MGPPMTDEAVYCLADGIGRGSWIEALGLTGEPAGDCAGPLYKLWLIEPAAHLCERHLLQYNLAGRKFAATLVKTSADKDSDGAQT